MYVTRPLSLYRKSPSTLSIPPADAPHSGYIVIKDEEAEAEDTFCWGMCQHKKIKKLPFPQDKILTIVHSSDHEHTTTKVWFIPVPDQPLSSNRFYIIKAKGKHKGKACRSARERDILTCCFTDILSDRRPKPFDFKDVYQQFKIHRYPGGGFFARSVAPDGVAPKFLRRKGWKVRISNSFKCKLSEALGLDTSLRGTLPKFDFPIYRKRSDPVVIGNWYTPFVFVREGLSLRRQMKTSLFYLITLEQWWEEIYSCVNSDSERRNVFVQADVQSELAMVSGMEGVRSNRSDSNGFTWFRACNPYNGRRISVGLSSVIMENVRWVEEAGGWVNGEESEVSVERREEVRSQKGWQRFGCYVLVESFGVRRLDGRLLLRYDFRHTDKIKCKWV